jgi:hypothetical protein
MNARICRLSLCVCVSDGIFVNMCMRWGVHEGAEQTGKCTYGNACQYAHASLSQLELDFSQKRDSGVFSSFKNDLPLPAPRRVDLYSHYRDRCGSVCMCAHES